ncbi:MAG: ABC transporter ATP-binding protein [Fimbriimonadaceae bacterium]|nr:ABC transporter ATP-binding protein [Fimbriimonadaceae bacterium]
MSAAIEISGLRKSFTISLSGEGSIKTAALWWRKRHIERVEVLRGVSLTVPQGECLAVVGRNGAGKSTLLSILAKVYLPSEGNVAVHGRLAPLLELGAGFHPDLSGRENVMFNAMILGLSRAEALARTPAILEFSGIEKFADAPVRTYSSGMLARLGFSVAVHVDAEILVVDEVLAVGDAEFEAKCYARIEQFREEGGTILFVSHDLDAIEKVAGRCVWLKDGLVKADGDVPKVLDAYRGSF